ncbi:hypothetical protein [Psychrobacter sp. JB385]|uniref:hypothetical protein n=1 Tax=Psychrobacter sp. JB385 TaxID=1434841 RepID=UPI00097E79C3|nr:hypothetical protein [Psychrobacter sp. JB385]SJN21286.1 hypothetical protein CZ794_03175 [Psychrobacter sp. JB385]
MTDNWQELGKSSTSPRSSTNRAVVSTRVPKKENIIFIGSEFEYNNFWLKNMFIAAAYPFVKNRNKFRQCDKVTIAYVDYGYTRLEKLAIEGLKNEISFTTNIRFVALKTKSEAINVLNEDRGNYKIQDLAFFCHGLNGKITLNYSGRPNIDLTSSDINRINNNNFLSSAIANSYACRTGMSDSLTLRTQGSFNSINEADSSNSFAQLFANKHNIDFYAFYKRTLYSNILNPKSDANKISEDLRNKRATNKDNIISILENYEALTHTDLGESYKNIWGLAPRGAVAEGTNGYSLWRKGGGLRMPIAAETPTGLPTSMTKFTPK